MNSLSDCVCSNGATGSATAQINYANLIARVSYLTPEIANYRLTEMSKIPYQSLAHQTFRGSFQVNAGVTSANLVLTPITSSIAGFVFVIRPTATATSGNGFFAFTQLASYNLLDQAGQSLVGGQPVSHALAVWQNSKFSRSTFTAENSLSGSSNAQNIYIVAHSGDILSSLSDGLALNSRRYSSAETLVLNFTSSLAAAISVDLYAFGEIILQQNPTGFNKISA
jgi:hypothetical protein